MCEYECEPGVVSVAGVVVLSSVVGVVVVGADILTGVDVVTGWGTITVRSECERGVCYECVNMSANLVLSLI